MARGSSVQGVAGGVEPRAEALARIAALVGAPHALTDPALMAPFLGDEGGLYLGRPAMVVRPATTHAGGGRVRG